MELGQFFHTGSTRPALFAISDFLSPDRVLLRLFLPEFESTAVEIKQPPEEQLAFIRAAFNCNKSTVAKILKKTRPTIYSWEAGGEIRAAKDRGRLDDIYAIAVEWNSRCRWPLGEYLDDAKVSGRSIAELLSEETLDKAAISKAIALIAPRVTEQLEVADSREKIEWADPRESEQPPMSNMYSPEWD